MKTKTSYGVALCRYNKEKNNRTEVLLIKKRYSYHFMAFVMGRYSRSNIPYLRYLFNNMSYAEKIDIISMQFCHMWYRIWLNNPEKYYNITDIYDNNNFSRKPIENKYSSVDIYKVYLIHKNKFENNFMKDNGVALRNLIQQSSDSEVMWEIPKGGKLHNPRQINFSPEFRITSEETDIDCAIREFYEETSVSPNKYSLFYDTAPIVHSHIDNDVNYKTIYYIAKLNNKSQDFKPFIDYRNFSQITEIEQIKWVSMSDLDFLTLSPVIHKRLNNLFVKVISTFKKSNKFKKTLKS